jgi:hypothetical protein
VIHDHIVTGFREDPAVTKVGNRREPGGAGERPDTSWTVPLPTS